MLNQFQYDDDRIFFETLLEDQPSELLENLFDFRPVIIKRREFNKIRKQVLENLILKHGESCMLAFEVCNMESGIQVDHIIPLSTNELNKDIRELSPEKGRKVKTQSFGSNHIDNLIIACGKCNGSKKHKILDRSPINLIFQSKKL